MVKNDKYRDIEELPIGECNMLCFLAYIGEPASNRVVDRFAMREGISKNTQNSMLNNLRIKGFCLELRTLRDTLWQVAPRYSLQVLKFLYAVHPDWVANFDSYRFFRMSKYTTLQSAMKSIVNGTVILAKGTIGTYDGSDFMDQFVEINYDPDLAPIANVIANTVFVNLVPTIVANLFWGNCDFHADNLMKMVDEYKLLDDNLKGGLRSLIALYHYYYDGTYLPVKNGKGLYDHLLLGIHAIHKEKYEEALSHYKSALEDIRRYGRAISIFGQPLHNYFLVALYIKFDNAEVRNEITQWAALQRLEKRKEAIPAVIIARRHRGDNSLKQLQTLIYGADTDLMRIMARCMAKLMEVHDVADQWVNVEPRYAIMRHEFQSMLDLDDNERQRLNALYGSTAYTPGRIRHKWEILLERVEELSLQPSDEIKPKEAEQPKERIIYVVVWMAVEPKVQKMLKNGLWSTPKNVVRYRYEERDYDCMDKTDIAICKLLTDDKYHIDYIFPLLVGCDRVFYSNNGKDLEPITINEEKAYLLLEKRGDGYQFASNLTEVSEDKTQYVVKHSNTLYSVITITPQQAEIYANLLRLSKLPLSAEEQLKKTMKAVAQRTEVHSPLLGDDNSLPTIEGSPRTIAQVKPMSPTSFVFSFRVKPLPDGSDYLQPGKGEQTIIIANTSKRYKVERDLKQEKKNADELRDFMAAQCVNEGSEIRSNEYNGTYDGFLSPEDLLTTMEFIKQNPDNYEMEWPEGGRIKLLPQPTKWDVAMRRCGGWFEIEGDVTIDEGKVIKIGELLNLAKDMGSNKFVKLADNEYVILSDAIRKQLARLEAIAQKDKDTIVVPINNAALFSEAMADGVAFANQEELQDIYQKIKASYKLKPQPPKLLKAKLRNYQLDGYQWMAQLDSWGAGACLADDMGLGKTVQTIALLLYKAKKGASLVVAPTSVVSNWENELHKFASSLNVTLLNAATDRKKAVNNAKANDVILTTYGILANDSDTISKKEWNIVCLDEAHTIKNRETKMAHAVHSLNAKTRVALTGTPLQNHLGELWSLFNFINPGLLGTYDFFRQKFVTTIEAQDKTRQEQLRRIVLPFMLRRTKQEVAKELPDKTESIRYVELSDEEMNVYELIRRDAKQKLEEEGKVSVSVLAEITKLRQAACAASLANPNLNFKSSKIEQLMQLVDNIGEEGNRILVFSQFTSFLKMAKEAFDKKKIDYLYLDGSTPLKQRESLVKKFQKGEGRIFMISLKAGGLGLNLTGANYVIHMDPWWNPAIEQQATDRAYRIGQKQKVTVFHLISSHTIEEKILRLHQSKRDLADSLLEGSNVSHKITEEDLNQLLT